MQCPILRGERFLVVDDEPLIAIDVQATLERAGARVVVARTIREALRYADYPGLSAGVLDFRVGDDDAEPVCEAWNRRAVPFIFFTGLSGPMSQRWRTTPLVPKPATPAKIVGAVKFVLSSETRDIIVRSQRRDNDTEKLDRIDQVVAEGEERIARMRRSIARLERSGADTSAAQQVLATTIEVVEGMRAHREMSAHLHRRW